MVGVSLGEATQPTFICGHVLMSPRAAFKAPGAPGFTASLGGTLLFCLQGLRTRPSKGDMCCCLMEGAALSLASTVAPSGTPATLRELEKLIQGPKGRLCRTWAHLVPVPASWRHKGLRSDNIALNNDSSKGNIPLAVHVTPLECLYTWPCISLKHPGKLFPFLLLFSPTDCSQRENPSLLLVCH